MARGNIGVSKVPAGKRLPGKTIPKETVYEYKCVKGHTVVYEKKLIEQPPFCTSCHMTAGQTNRYELSKSIQRDRQKKRKQPLPPKGKKRKDSGKGIRTDTQILNTRKRAEKAHTKLRKSIKRVRDGNSKRWRDWRESDGIVSPVVTYNLNDKT